MRVYLDNCCFNRPFDDQRSLKIRLETEAKLYVQSLVLEESLDLIWSFILEFENAQNPFEERKKSIKSWKSRAKDTILSSDEILEFGQELIKLGLKPKDALHVACAKSGKCNYFLTTDTGIINKKKSISGVDVMNPVDFVFLYESRIK